MDMVLNPADCNCVHAVIPQDSRHVGPQFGLDFFGDRWHAILGAEHDVDVVADPGHCRRPSGTHVL
jgi:hypothetical protein